VSKIFVKYWYLIFGLGGGGIYFFMQSWKRSVKMQKYMDRLLLKVPVFGDLVIKSSIARWTRTVSTDVRRGRAAGRGARLGRAAPRATRSSPRRPRRSRRTSPPAPASPPRCRRPACSRSWCCRCAPIGEESGSLDAMLGKAAEFYEDEVDEAVKGLSALMEPFIIVILGTLIGGIVVSMYLPIFKLGQVV
jgi:type IV pilus assembly protein PilC